MRLKLGLAIELALLEGERVARRRFIGQPLAIVRLERRHLDHGGGQLRPGVGDRDVETGGVQAEQHIAFLDMLVVAHIDLGDAAGDFGADIRPRRLHIGIVGRNIAPARQIEEEAYHQDEHGPADQEHAAIARDPASGLRVRIGIRHGGSGKVIAPAL